MLMVLKNIQAFKKFAIFVLFQVILLGIVILFVNSGFLDSLTVLSRKWINATRLNIDDDLRSKIKNVAKEQVAVVWIDPYFFEKESISIQGLHRGYYAQVIQNILDDDPNAVVIDVLFEKKFRFWSWEENKLLRRLFEEYDNQLAQTISSKVVLGAVYDFLNQKLIKPEDDLLGSGSIGHVKSIRRGASDISVGVYDVLPPQNGVLPLFLQGWLIAQKTFFKGLGADIDIGFKKYQDSLVFNFKKDFKLPLSRVDGNSYIPVPIYFNNIFSSDLNYLSFWDVYHWKWDFQNKVVFIGAVDPALNDMELTLGWNIPGVGVHVNGFLNLQVGDFVHLPSEKEILWILLILFGINFVFVIWTKKNVLALGILFVLEVIALIVWSITLSLPSSLSPSRWLPFLTLLVALLFYFLGSWIYISWEKEWLASFMEGLVSVYVGSKIKSKIKNSSTTPQAKISKVAVLFADMEWFSTKAEKLGVTTTVYILNKYLTVFSQAIKNYGGNVDKFIGDAVMAFWEWEIGPYKATLATIDAVKGIKQLSEQIKKEIWVSVNTRVGLSRWDAILGDVGSDDRLDYTVIGDSVNVASRLEWLNKIYWTNIIASENFIKALKDKSKFLIRRLDITKVKWREQQLKVFEIMPILAQDLEISKLKALREYIQEFERGVAQYHQGNFEQAKLIFEKLLQRWPHDKVVKFYLARIAGIK